MWQFVLTKRLPTVCIPAYIAVNKVIAAALLLPSYLLEVELILVIKNYKIPPRADNKTIKKL